MAPAQAISTGFRRSFRFSGRATRSEFWWFAPVAIVPPALVGAQLRWDVIEPMGIWRVAAVFAAAIPFLAATSRRLQDTGEEGHQAVYPFMPFVLLWLGYQATYWIGLSIGVTGNLAGIALILVIAAFLLLLPLYVVACFAALMMTASVLGMTLVPTDPKPNRYGPVPV